jgi:hydrogenase maturation protein HypF
MVGMGDRSAGDVHDEGDMSSLRAIRIHVRGVVQGVGFRPFVYGHAIEVGLNGWVRNTSAGVEIHAEGEPEAIDAFLSVLQAEPPPLARIHSFDWEDCPPDGFGSFEILASEVREGDFIPVSPDMSLCDDCRRELFDPNDRRYRYPFINCTNCGPRFTIITDIPYDRPNTTMAPFEMCTDCAGEYHNPLDRRFHAQPVACPVCGPTVWLEAKGGRVADGEAAIQAARLHLREGRVVAIKGLGGFHLACDATNPEAVVELRRRKLRVDKPFAVMVPNLETAHLQAELSEAEATLLTHRERPIVLVKRRESSSITPAVAPGQNRLGLMLPYTPLHELILEPEEGYPTALVMTSGNISEEPIAIGNREALTRLDALADVFLLHDRAICTRCDDSVVTALRGDSYPLRRSRGFAPYPVLLPWQGPAILAGGPELKNTFCLTQGTNAFISHHIGDLENYETLASFEDGIQQYETLFRVKPVRFAYDLHPNYLATRYILARSEREGIPAVGVQHHHAHIASCMAENQLPLEAKVIGLAFDGTGYGEDGAIWGGEVLLGGYAEVERVAHLKYIPLPGGDAAIRAPWRTALAWLWASDLAWDSDLPPVSGSSDEERRVLLAQLEQGLNAPPTSSLGRLFDAVSALIGVRQTVNYEAQAAMELEAIASPSEGGAYPILLEDAIIDPTEMFAAIVADLRSMIPVDVIASRFHNAIVRMVIELCDQQRETYGLDEVVLSGGVWQNMILLEKSMTILHENDYTVWVHHQVPANDGGVSLGQAAIVGARKLAGLD